MSTATNRNSRGGGSGGGSRELRRGQSFGYEGGYDKNRGGGFGDDMRRSTSPHSLQWRSRGGGFSNSSRTSSPARSHRGKHSRNNSPHGSSRGNSRRNSPHSRPGSPPRQTRVFRRAGSPRSTGGRSTVSRTPSPPHSYREPATFGRGGARVGSAATMGRQNKRDSRDLEGWTRQEVGDRGYRRDEALWDPRSVGKPPSGRPKSATLKSSLPPRFQRGRDLEELER